MANFTGLGQGFNQGLATGGAIGAGIQNRGLEKAIAEANLKEKRTDQDIATAKENVLTIGKMAQDAIAKGAMTKEQAARAFGPMIAAAKANALKLGELRGRNTTGLVSLADSIGSVLTSTATPTEAATTAATADVVAGATKAGALQSFGVPKATALETGFNLQHPPAPAAPPASQLFTADVPGTGPVNFDMSTAEGKALFKNLPPGSKVNKVGTGGGRTIEMLPGGGVRITEGNMPPVPASKAYGTAEQRADAGSVLTSLRDARDALESLREEAKNSPSKFGAMGTIRGAAETTGGVLTDIVKTLGLDDVMQPVMNAINSGTSDIESGDVAEKYKTVAQLDPVRHSLAIGLARSRNDRGRLLVAELNKAYADTDLTGFKSVEQITGKLDEVLGEINRGIERQEGALKEVSGVPGASGAEKKRSPGKDAESMSTEDLSKLSIEELLKLKKQLEGAK